VRRCAAFFASSVAACSFVGVRGPDGTTAHCTDNYGMVVLDSVGAGVALTLTGVVIDDLVTVKPDDYNAKALLPAYSILFAAISVLYLAADTYGIINVTMCRSR
jgi:hypothetical protein